MKVIDIKKIRGSSFRIQPVAAVIAISMASLLPANLVHANAAFGVNTDISGATINVPTYFAATSQGIQPAFDPATHAYSTQGVTVDTGMPPMRDPEGTSSLMGSAMRLKFTNAPPMATATNTNTVNGR